MGKGGKMQTSRMSASARSERPVLISGIDVGVHTSVALLGLGGNIISLVTLVHPQNSQILDYITNAGNVLVLSTDRARPPSQMKKIAAAISAKIVLPAKNMTKKKKRVLIEDYMKEREERKESPKAMTKTRMNDHEKAALASAIFAYKKFRPGFKKLEDRLAKERRKEKLEKMRNQLFLMMIRDI